MYDAASTERDRFLLLIRLVIAKCLSIKKKNRNGFMVQTEGRKFELPVFHLSVISHKNYLDKPVRGVFRNFHISVYKPEIN